MIQIQVCLIPELKSSPLCKYCVASEDRSQGRLRREGCAFSPGTFKEPFTYRYNQQMLDTMLQCKAETWGVVTHYENPVSR